jgi:ADP-ribose pyrophosphatase YjhB (NUDIX family)
VCVNCGETTWRNPLPVGVLLVPVRYAEGDGLVVVRRDIEPARGELCLPGGFIEYGETWMEGAARELREEAGLHADPAEVRLFDVISTGVHVMVFGIVPARDIDDMPESAPTDESTEWIVIRAATELAFPSHTDAAATFFARS